MQSDDAINDFAGTNSTIGKSDDQGPQILYRFGIKAKMDEQANEHLVIIKSTVQDFQ